jgi:hypothetical protein
MCCHGGFPLFSPNSLSSCTVNTSMVSPRNLCYVHEYLSRELAGHIEQAERGAIHKSLQAHKHFYPFLPTAMAFVSYGFVLVQVQVQVQVLQRVES